MRRIATASKEVLARIPEKLDPVGRLIRRLFPRRPYLVLVWTEDSNGKAIVEMITNCGVFEAAERMRATVRGFDEAAAARKAIGRIGHACLASAVLVFLMQLVLDDPGIFNELMSGTCGTFNSALMR